MSIKQLRNLPEVKELYKSGKQKGSITRREFDLALPPHLFIPEQRMRILEFLRKSGIKVPLRESIKPSPLFNSSMEFLEHGLYHFLRSETSLDMKFAILHIDQSIELLLKAKILSLGESIYKNPKETMSIWATYDKLEGKSIKIPEKPDLELLHEERNSLQHKYGNPAAEHTSYMVSKAVSFIKRFSKEELGLGIEDYITSEFLDQL